MCLHAGGNRATEARNYEYPIPVTIFVRLLCAERTRELLPAVLTYCYDALQFVPYNFVAGVVLLKELYGVFTVTPAPGAEKR